MKSIQASLRKFRDMSIETLKNVFAEIKNCSTWLLQLLKISISKTTGIKYVSRQI